MNEQDMENLDSIENSDHDLISTKTYSTVNKREARCQIHDRIKQRQSEWKGALKATRNMVNVDPEDHEALM